MSYCCLNQAYNAITPFTKVNRFGNSDIPVPNPTHHPMRRANNYINPFFTKALVPCRCFDVSDVFSSVPRNLHAIIRPYLYHSYHRICFVNISYHNNYYYLLNYLSLSAQCTTTIYIYTLFVQLYLFMHPKPFPYLSLYMATVSPSSSTVDILFIYFLSFLHRVPLPVIKTTICLYTHVEVHCKSI